MELKPEHIALVIGFLAVAYFLVRRRSGPEERTFRCARCSSVAQHTTRTINASRDGRSSFFCNSCHSEWVRSHPHQGRRVGGSRSGCLGILACLVFIPVALILGWLMPNKTMEPTR